DPDDAFGEQAAEDRGDHAAPVTAVRQEFVVAQPVHQLDPRPGDRGDAPAGGGRLPLKPNPGRDGTTTWNAGAPAAVGSASSSTRWTNSAMLPGQPCVSRSGAASGRGERRCRKGICRPEERRVRKESRY